MYVVDAIYALSHYATMDGPNSERIITPMPKAMVEALDNFRFSNRIPSRAEAIRKLLEMGLQAAKSKEAEVIQDGRQGKKC